jgi:hypothetical protein
MKENPVILLWRIRSESAWNGQKSSDTEAWKT